MGPNPLLKIKRWNIQTMLVAMDWELEHFTLQVPARRDDSQDALGKLSRAIHDPAPAQDVFVEAWHQMKPADFRRTVLWGSKNGGSIAQVFKLFDDALAATPRGVLRSYRILNAVAPGLHDNYVTSVGLVSDWVARVGSGVACFGQEERYDVFVRMAIGTGYGLPRYLYFPNIPRRKKTRKFGEPGALIYGTLHFGVPGALIHGTLRDEDLIPAFSQELIRLSQASFDRIDARYTDLHGDPFAGGEETAEWVDANPEAAAELIQELSDALNELAPPGYYFGAHPGDGSDFGFWPLVDEEL